VVSLPEAAGPADLLDGDVRRETCVVALSHAWGRGRFEVRVKGRTRGAQHVVARSPDFPVPHGMVINDEGAVRAAHRSLLLHLEAAGWRLMPAGNGAWYERRLWRQAPDPATPRLDRVLVSARPGAAAAEFVALALDDYGNAKVLARSPRFARAPGAPIEEKEPAVTAHGTLLEDLEDHGWRVSGTLESWYGATLARRRL
jgi:hypothetical protein